MPTKPPITYEQLERTSDQLVRTTHALEHASEEQRLTRQQGREVLDAIARSDKRRATSDAAWIALAGALEAWFPEHAAKIAEIREAARSAGAESKEAAAAAGRAEQATKEIKTQAAEARLPTWAAVTKFVTDFLNNFLKAEREKRLTTLLLVVIVAATAGLVTYFWVHPALNKPVEKVADPVVVAPARSVAVPDGGQRPPEAVHSSPKR